VGFGEHQVGLGGLLGWIFGFWVFLSVLGVDPVLFGAIFDVFWGLRCVLVGFMLIVMVRRVNFGFWRTSCRFRGTFRVDLWLLGFSFVFGFDPVLVWGFFDVFCGLCWVLLGSRWS